MDDQFDNRHTGGFSMSGDVFNPDSETYNDQNIPSMTGKAETGGQFSMNGDAYNPDNDTFSSTGAGLEDTGYISPELDEGDDWRDQIHQELQNDLCKSTTDLAKPTNDPVADAVKDLKKGKDVKVHKSLRVAPNPCGCCYGNDGKCFNSVEKQNRIDRKAMDEKRKLYEQRKKMEDNAKLAEMAPAKAAGPPHDLSKEDPKLKAEIAACKVKIKEIKYQIDTADERDLSTYLRNRLNKGYENKIYELKCLEDALNPQAANMEKMEKLRAQYFNLEKQKAEIDLKMMSIETKFRSENMSIEEKDDRPDVETMIQGHDDDMDRLWALRANRRKIYTAEYNVDPKTGLTTHDKSDFKKTAFMRKQLIAHRARKIAEHNANALK